MKRTFLLSSICAGVAILTLTSYGSGPHQGGAGNRTGSASSIGDCSTGGCHAANTSNTAVTILVTTGANQPVTTYTPGAVYKVTVGGSNTGSLPRFGFQASCVQASAGTQAGSFAVTATNMSLHSSGGLQLVEHNVPIEGVVPGVYAASFDWTAPAAGTGTVRFYATLNAVNFNGTVNGDQPNTATPVDLAEASTTGIASLKPAILSVYPNPATNELHLKLSASGKPATVRVWDMGGRLLIDRAMSADPVVDISALSAGSYFVLATQGGQPYAASFVKK